MHPWAVANLKLRADRDAMDELKRREGDGTVCPACGRRECPSATCEMSRRRAVQRAVAQSQAVAAGLVDGLET